MLSSSNRSFAIALVRYLSCPPALRSVPPQLAAIASEDWETLLAYVEERGLDLAAYECLVARPDGATCLSPAQVSRLRHRYIQSAARVQWLNRELARVCAALSANGIQPIVLKGPHTGPLLWDDPALRPFGDLDLWVCPGELVAVDRVLRGLGYGGGPLHPGAAPDLTRHELPGYHLMGIHGQYLASVDLHYRACPDTLPLPDEAGVYARSVPWPLVAGARVMVAEDLLIYLCAHLVRHLFEESVGWKSQLFLHTGYKYLSEIGRLAVLPCGLDWSVVMTRLSTSRHQGALVLPLRLIQALWGVPLPPDISALWRMDPLGEWVCRRLLESLDSPLPEWEQDVLSLWMYRPMDLRDYRFLARRALLKRTGMGAVRTMV